MIKQQFLNTTYCYKPTLVFCAQVKMSREKAHLLFMNIKIVSSDGDVI